MANSVENKLSNYQVSEDTKEMFANLSIFAKNCEIKNTEKYDAYEDEVSKWMGNLLVKYFNGGITHDDISALLNFISDYNKTLNEIQQKDEDDYLVESILRLTLKSNREKYNNTEISVLYQNSIFKIIVDNLKIWLGDDIWSNIPSEENTSADTEGDENLSNTSSNENNSTDTESESDNNSSDTLAEKNTLTDTEKEKYIASSLWSYIWSGEKNKENIFRKHSSVSAEEDIFKILDDRYIMLDNSHVDSNLKTAIVNIITSSHAGDFNKLLDILKNKDKYYILGYRAVTFNDNNVFEKLSASSKEVLNAESGENQVFFDLIFEWNKEIKGLLSNLTENFVGNINDQTRYISIVIPYKELNSLYRNTLDSEMSEIILYINKDKLEPTFITPENGYRVTNSTFSLLRAYRTSDSFLFRYFYSDGAISANDTNNIVRTTKLISYQYTNPYIARRSAESEIIKYYIGDDYISNNYGQFNYEKLEIATFLEKYRIIRDYYYKVLLNEAFINEPAYKLYEKEFLFFWAIEQTITSKVDNIKNIDTFDLNDIKNFLVSYGLDDLYNIISSGPFIDRELYSKRILKSYIKLVQYKGSRGILDILENIFSVDDKTLKIYRQALIKSGDDYKIIRVDRSISNILSVLKNDETSANMDLVTLGDPYWKVKNTNSTDVEKLNNSFADFVNTKYIVPEMTVEIAKYYFTTRIFFALIDELLKKDNNNENKLSDTIKINIGEDSTDSMDLKDYIDCFRIIYKKYLLKYIARSLEAKAGEDSKFWGYENSKNPQKVFAFKFDPTTFENGLLTDLFHEDTNHVYTIEKIITIDDDKNISDLDDRNNKEFLRIYYKYMHSTSLLREEFDTINYFLKAVFLVAKMKEIKEKNLFGIYNIDGLLKIIFVFLGLASRVFNGQLNCNQIKEEKVLYDAILEFFDKVFMSSGDSISNDSIEFGDTAKEKKIEKYINDTGVSKKIDILEAAHRYTNGEYSNLLEEVANILSAYSISESISDANPEDLYSVLVGIIENLEKTFSNINVMFSADDVKLSEFLRQTIVYFISYTSEVFNNKLSTIISYNSESELYETQDYLESIEVGTSLADSFYYDEELFIKEENTKNN